MANVSSNNLTTLYSGAGINVRPTSAYGNSNVVSLLNAGTDGANTITNIVATGNVTANNFIGNLIGNTSNANYANFAGNLVVAGNETNVYVRTANTHIESRVQLNNAYTVQYQSENSWEVFPEDDTTGANPSYAWIRADNNNINSPNVFIENQPANTGIAQRWTFDSVGNLVLPHGAIIKDSSNNSLALGLGAGNTNQGVVSIAIGSGAGQQIQQDNAIAIGSQSGYSNQGSYSIGIGHFSGLSNQGSNSVGIGSRAGSTDQGINSVAVGSDAGNVNQGNKTVAIGSFAGSNNQGINSIAIGANAGITNQANNTIILNATGSNLNQSQANSFTVKPVHNANTANVMFYDATTGEITYDLASGVVANVANYSNFAGNLVLLGDESNIFVSTSNVAINSRVQVVNTYTQQTQYKDFWEVFSADDTTGPYSSKAWIKVDDTVINQPVITLRTQPANTGIEQRWVFDSTGNFSLPGNTFQINYANGTQVNLDGPVANANYANFAGTAFSVDIANVVGIGNIATLNLDGNASNVLFGNGVFAAIPTDDANFANYAGNVTISAQPNITSTGNLVSLTINNSNVVLPTKQFNPNGITVGSTANINLMANSSFVDVDYGNGQGGGNLRFGKSSTFVKARGNSSSIATAATNDIAGRTNYMFYNGTSNVLAAATQTNVTTFNANSNAITTGGQYQIVTGNPQGDQGNANALSNQNLYTFDSAGRLTITQGAAGGAGSIININSYGTAAGGNAATTQSIAFVRYRGNRDNNLSVQPLDQLGLFGFLGYNGNGLYSARTSSLQCYVDSTYTAGNTVIPSYFLLSAAGVNNQWNHFYHANGNVTFASTQSGSGGYLFINNANVSNSMNVTGNVSGANVSINTNGFMKLASYTAAALNAITGSIGWMAAVSDSGTLTNPNGMIAFWDTTNNRWSYVADNSPV